MLSNSKHSIWGAFSEQTLSPSKLSLGEIRGVWSGEIGTPPSGGGWKKIIWWSAQELGPLLILYTTTPNTNIHTDSHTLMRLRGSSQYAPWSHGLHNIIKQFKLAYLTQAENAAMLRGGCDGGGESPQQPPYSIWQTSSGCLLAWVSLSASRNQLVPLLSLCFLGQKHCVLLKAAIKTLWRGGLTDTIQDSRMCDDDEQEELETIQKPWDPFHLIITTVWII